ncbi:MAG: helix-turn-helix domain-containing protein [Dehalococcoidia bacterium]
MAEEHRTPWYTIEEAADYLRVSKRTMHNLVAKEQVTAYRVSPKGPLRFRGQDLDAALAPVSKRITVLRDVDYPALAELWDNEDDDIYDELLADDRQ